MLLYTWSPVIFSLMSNLPSSILIYKHLEVSFNVLSTSDIMDIIKCKMSDAVIAHKLTFKVQKKNTEVIILIYDLHTCNISYNFYMPLRNFVLQ